MMTYVTCDVLHLQYEKCVFINVQGLMPIVYGRSMGNDASSVYIILERRNMQCAISHAKVT
jgi:hypothetical protein